MITLTPFLILAAAVFVCGVATIMIKRNALGILMGVELILNAATINLVAFGHFGVRTLDGQIFALFIIVIAAAEAAVALAIFLNFYNSAMSIDVEKAGGLKG